MSGTLKLQPCIHFSTSLLLIVNGTLSSEHCLYILLQSTESPMDVRNSIAPCTRCELAVERKQRIFHCMCHVQCSLWTRLYKTGLNLIIDTTGSSVKQTCWLHNWYFQWSTFYSMQCNLFGAILFLFMFFFHVFYFSFFTFLVFFDFFPFFPFFRFPCFSVDFHIFDLLQEHVIEIKTFWWVFSLFGRLFLTEFDPFTEKTMNLTWMLAIS